MLAGAGTGKTKALTARIVHLLNLHRARPNEILAVTFTNKAAREMKDRVLRMLGPVAEGMPWMGTFHSLSVKILRRHAELVGLKPSFTILDTDDQLRLLKQLIQARNIDDKRWPPACWRSDRRLEEPRADAGPRALVRWRRLQQPRDRALRRVSGPPAQPERLRFR